MRCSPVEPPIECQAEPQRAKQRRTEEPIPTIPSQRVLGEVDGEETGGSEDIDDEGQR
jgi:hypothetical protein